MKTIKAILLLSISAMFLVSCSSSLQQRQAADDLYYTPDKNQNRDIIKEFEEDYNKAIAENEQKDKQEATQNDTVMDFKKSTNPYEKILVDDMNEAYDKRQEAMRDPYYGMNNYYSVRFSDDYWYASSFDPMFYNTVVMGNTVWVEPNWISSHFRYGYNYGSFYNYGGFYNRPYSSWNFGFSHYPYSMNSFYPYSYGYGYGYNYYGYGYGGYNGFYNPYSQSNFYNYERRRTPYQLSLDNSDTKEINRIRSANNTTSRKVTRIKNTEKEDPRIRTIRTRNADERANEDNSLRIRRSRANSNSARAENRNNQINSNNGTTLRRVIQENRNSTSKETRYRTKPNSEANPKRLRNNIRKTNNNNYSNNNYNSSNNNSNNSSGSIRSTGSSSSNSSSGSSSSGSSSSSSSGRRR